MNEKTPRQGIVRLNHLREVITVELNRNTHPHVLGTLTWLTVASTQHVSILQRLEPEILEHEITRIVAGRIQFHAVLGNRPDVLVREQTVHRQTIHAIGKMTRGLLLVVVNHQTGSQLTIVRVVTGLHHRTDLGGKLVQIRSPDTVLNLGTHLLCDQIRVHMGESVCELLNASQNLVEGHGDAVAVTLCDVNMIRHLCYCILHPYF